MTKASKITYTAVFAAIATVLMYFEFPIPFMPPFLKVDLSGAVVPVSYTHLTLPTKLEV